MSFEERTYDPGPLKERPERAAFFERMRRAAERANLSPEAADELAAEAVNAARAGRQGDRAGRVHPGLSASSCTDT